MEQTAYGILCIIMIISANSAYAVQSQFVAQEKDITCSRAAIMNLFGVFGTDEKKMAGFMFFFKTTLKCLNTTFYNAFERFDRSLCRYMFCALPINRFKRLY